MRNPIFGSPDESFKIYELIRKDSFYSPPNYRIKNVPSRN
jgi:hypothetical protein